MEEQKPKGSGMEKIATFIVDKRNLFFLLYAFALIFSIVATGWVKVENDITTYLPEDTETRQGLTVMNDNFVTYGTARVMVSNVTYETAENICSDLESIDGVTSVDFDDTTDHYKSASALFSVTFDGTTTDDISIHALHTIRDMLAGYDTYIDTEVGVDTSADLQSEMSVILVLAAIVIVLVLTLTSRSYAEVPLQITTFGAAAVLNMGTNFLCGTISFISNSDTVILQLALAIDYAIILCHRFSDEHETKDTREACIAALSKAIPEISSSSLTTISGLGALAFMHFGIGRDMATVLIKAILFSLLSVFTLMPGLLMVFSKKIDATRHKNLIPKITLLDKFEVATRFIDPPIFAVVVVVTAVLANKCPYCYSYTDLVTAKQSESQIAHQKIKNTFGVNNMVAVIVPTGDYDSERQLLKDLDSCAEVKSTQGLANIDAMDGYKQADALTPDELQTALQAQHDSLRRGLAEVHDRMANAESRKKDLEKLTRQKAQLQAQRPDQATAVAQARTAQAHAEKAAAEAQTRLAEGQKNLPWPDAAAMAAARAETQNQRRTLQAALDAAAKRRDAFSKELAAAQSAAQTLAEQAGDTASRPDPAAQQQALTALQAERKNLRDQNQAALHRQDTNRDALTNLKNAITAAESARANAAMLDNLSKTINGNLTQKQKLPFEQYVQSFYFDGVVAAANRRFTRMTGGQYTLRRRQSADIAATTALELDVFAAYTGKPRPVGSLSGGESFLAALSLALGISDTIQESAGGISVDTLFVDEGFGTLDADALQKAIDTLTALAGSDKLVGIISHVETLQDRIPKQILVQKTKCGSKAQVELG